MTQLVQKKGKLWIKIDLKCLLFLFYTESYCDKFSY